MKIAIATGIEALDKKIKEKIESESQDSVEIVYYREFLLKNEYDVCILSRRLNGAKEIEEILFKLRCNDTRIIYITGEDDEEEIKICIKYGIYDIITGAVDADKINNILKNPMKFKDIANTILKHANVDFKLDTIDKINDDMKPNIENVYEKEIEEPKKILEVQVMESNTVIAFWGYTGGIGTSTIVYETAKGLRHNHKKVIVLDFEEITGNISTLSKIEESNFDKLVKEIDEENMTYSVLKEYIKKDSDGIDYITGINLRNAYKVRVEHLIKIVNILKQHYPYILICAGNGIQTAGVLASMYCSDNVVAITLPNKTDVLRTIEMINFMHVRWEIDKEKYLIVLNKETLTSEIDGKLCKELAEINNIKYFNSIGTDKSKIYKTTKELFQYKKIETKIIEGKYKGGINNVFKSLYSRYTKH